MASKRGQGSGGAKRTESINVPEGAEIRIVDLSEKKYSDKELEDLIKQAAKSGVGFVILNAPFKVPSAKSAG
jgi:hypothetical protein